jgi:hypothetical protein
MMVEKDTAFIPSDLSPAERHLLVALAVWKRVDFKYVGPHGAVSEEPGIRSFFNAISPSNSRETSNESLNAE